MCILACLCLLVVASVYVGRDVCLAICVFLRGFFRTSAYNHVRHGVFPKLLACASLLLRLFKWEISQGSTPLLVGPPSYHCMERCTSLHALVCIYEPFDLAASPDLSVLMNAHWIRRLSDNEQACSVISVLSAPGDYVADMRCSFYLRVRVESDFKCFV